MGVTMPTQEPRETEAQPVRGAVDTEARKEAIASLKRKRRFAQNAVTYVGVNGVLWLIWALSDRSAGGSVPWPTWVSAIWGLFLALDWWRAYAPWPRSLHRPITEEEIARELDRLGGRPSSS